MFKKKRQVFEYFFCIEQRDLLIDLYCREQNAHCVVLFTRKGSYYWYLLPEFTSKYADLLFSFFVFNVF